MTFAIDPAHLPRPANLDRRDRGRERWHERAAAARDDDPSLAAFMDDVTASADGGALLDAVFGGSPFLGHALVCEADFVRQIWTHGPHARFAALLADLTADLATEADASRLMAALRVAKRRAALLIALADIAGAWPLETVTRALSDLADTALSLAADHLLRDAAHRGELVLPHPEAPSRQSGLIVLGMGKLGGRELNYSSDIDLIVFYDEDKLRYTGHRSVQECCVRIARELARIMETRTGDGYVFRTDLRLRPDPGSTPSAVSLEAAEIYYEGFGQNWERAAMIKARPVAGDLAAGADFLRFLKAFIWRKHLDFAAIQDIHSIKRQINAHRGGARVAVAGHNIKLGRGGIREIEFFAQTQQLIWGGRQPGLRASGTVAALAALAEAGHVAAHVAPEMTEAYTYLRRLEHRLQMIDDKQTQTLPTDSDALRELALFAGENSVESFADSLTRRLTVVEGHYARLFEDAPPLSAARIGNLVFTGGENDPETLQTLTKLGFANPAAVAGQIRGWHHGRIRATRSTRARELLTELTPALLSALAATAEPDTAFVKFDDFLARQPSGVQVFSLFYANPELLGLVAEIMGNAPRLADRLARYPGLLDSVVSPGFFDPVPPPPVLAEELRAALDEGTDYEDVLTICRRWANDRRFQVGVQLLRNLVNAEQSAVALSDVADTVLAALLPAVEAEISRVHGRLPGSGVCVVAMGKMGSREMTATSDLDLILVYDTPADVDQSDGPKPLAPSAYYARLTTRFLNAVTAQTGDGALYEVDMRLRPSGNAGPLACSLEAFVKYHASDAWTWEHMALTRARIVAGSPALRPRVEAAVAATLRGPRDPARLLADVADMRARMAKEHKAASFWEVKHLRGGLVDIEFIAQTLQLRHAHDHPSILSTSTDRVLARAEELGLLDAGAAETLRDALHLWWAVQAVLRQTIEGAFREDTAPDGLKAVLIQAAGTRTFDELKARIAERAQAVYDLFQTIIEHPHEASP